METLQLASASSHDTHQAYLTHKKGKGHSRTGTEALYRLYGPEGE